MGLLRGRGMVETLRGATLTSGAGAEGVGASRGSPCLFHLAASPPPLEGISKVTTLTFESSFAWS